MIAITKEPCPAANAQHDALFLGLRPAIEHYARLAFRNLSPQFREEAICAVVAHAFCAFRRLVERGKQDIAYATPLARYAVARYRAGRCIGNRLNSRDVCDVTAQRRRGFSLHSLNIAATSNAWHAALADDTLTPILDQVAFRMDFPAWLQTLSRRDQKLAMFLAVGNTPSEASRQFRISVARISQVRRELRRSWKVFEG
jgi:hypothetical protein